MSLPWPTDWVVGGTPRAPWAVGPHPEPASATLVLFFNLECPGCVARAVPFVKRLGATHGAGVEARLVHTGLGHRDLEREQVVPTLVHFATDYARLEAPVALDLSGDLAREWGIEGTPHWFVFDAAGRLRRSVFGSQDNARTRIDYLLTELSGAPEAPEPA